MKIKKWKKCLKEKKKIQTRNQRGKKQIERNREDFWENLIL